MAIKDPDSPILSSSTKKMINQYNNNAFKNTNILTSNLLEQRSSELLGQYGLNTPAAVKKFLKSPLGKSVIEEIRTEVLMEQIVKELNQAMFMAHELLEKQMRAAFAEWKEEKKERLARKAHHIMEQIEELQTHITKKEPSPAIEYNIPDMEQMMQHYDHLIHETELQQKLLTHRELALETERRAFEMEELSVREQYALYDEYTHDDYFEPLMQEDGFIHDKLIQYKQSLSQEIDNLFHQINHHIEQGKDTNPLIHKQNAFHQRKDRLDEMLSVHQQEKVYLDQHGNMSSNAKEAVFIVSKDKKLIQEQGEYFLLSANQDWQTVKNNPEARSEAKKSFSDNHMVLMTVKCRLRHNEQLDLSTCKKQINENALATAQVNLEKRLYENKLRELQSAQAIIQKQLQESMNNNQKNDTAMLQPIPKPAASSNLKMNKTIPTPKPHPSSTLKKSLNELKSSLNDFNQLITLAPGEHTAKSRQLITSLFNQHSKLSALLPQAREQIFLQMAKYGVQSSLQDQFKHKIISSINNQYEEILPYKNKANEAEYKSPTPFNMTPDPYKK